MSRTTTTSRTMSSLVEELEHYAVQILDSRESLTAIQQGAAREALKAELALRGIKYDLYHSWDSSFGTDSSNIHFAFSSLFVEDTSILADVRGVGLFPISLSLGEHISISFEPRHLKDAEMSLDRWRHVSNGEYSELIKGQIFSFRGRVTYGKYFFKKLQTEHFRFGIVAADPGGDGGVASFLARLFRSV